MGGRCGFPEDHPQFAGALPRIRTGVVERLTGHDLVVVLGAPVFTYHIHAEGPHVPPEATVFQLTDDPNAAAWAPIGTAIITSLRPALETLLTVVEPRRAALLGARRERNRVPADRSHHHRVPAPVDWRDAAVRRADRRRGAEHAPDPAR